MILKQDLIDTYRLQSQNHPPIIAFLKIPNDLRQVRGARVSTAMPAA
jgi:hypothetical protein